MKKLVQILLVIIMFLGFGNQNLHAQEDTTWVQTFTFDDITKRRDVYSFPDDSRTYRKILMYYKLRCDAATTADQFPCGEWDYLTYTNIYEHTGAVDADGNEIIETYEIGRFITPYGINLSLGQGFTWVYDVTDYAHLLQGDVDISAGNNQELLDLKFMMIEGTPARDVVAFDRIWGTRRSYSYRDLDNDTALPAITLDLDADASQYKVVTRLTGHGHHSDTGGFPHCCEWKDNRHYLHVDGQEVADWSIFQHTECALNPVYPQGGTWPGAREGWCPGDIVKDHVVDITPYVTANQVTLDYSITPVPSNNEAMGNGNYQVAMHLLQYGDQNFTNDAEIYDVIQPSDNQYYARLNPVCDNPKIVIKNNGSAMLTSLNITYGVSGGDMRTKQWTGNLAPNETERVSLVIPNSSFWVGDDAYMFNVSLSNPNGSADENTANDHYQTHFELPDVYPPGTKLRVKTNNRGNENSYVIKNVWGDVVVSRNNLSSNTIYWDTLNFNPGCYTLEFLDSGNDGLSYWADAAAGSGNVSFYHHTINTSIKGFEPEFGRMIRYSFTVGDLLLNDENTLSLTPKADVYPNPAKDQFTLELSDFTGNAEIELLNAIGEVLTAKTVNTNLNPILNFSTKNYSAGVYFIKVKQGAIFLTKKVIVQ